MNTNAVADMIGDRLKLKHVRTYRNKAPSGAVFPYVIFRIESVMNSFPSEDLYVNVDVYESPNKSIREVEALADAIDKDINHEVMISTGINLHFEREQRQSVDTTELVTAYMINMRYAVRAYFE